jgi:hypothetical protein
MYAITQQWVIAQTILCPDFVTLYKPENQEKLKTIE